MAGGSMTRNQRAHRPRRRPRPVAVLLALAIVTGSGMLFTAGPAAADTLTIGGYVYHDVDGDGHRDSGEPGVAGLRVHHISGVPTTTTAPDGHYSLTDLPEDGRMIVQTGWFRSQCYDAVNLNCPAGPGDDNDIPVRNQFLELPLAGRTSADDINVGVLPDWPGPGLTPPGGGETPIPGNTVDVAARLSAGPDTCSPDAYGICGAGATFEQVGQIHNQGTQALTGVRARLYVPPGDCLTGVSVVEYATSAGLGPMTTTPPPSALTCQVRQVELAFAGTLVTGGVIRLAITGTVRDGPGTPGCTTDTPPAPTCSTAAPQGRTLLLGVSHIAERGDPDSDFCARGDLRTCPTALHDKRREPDEVDPAGHNIAADLGGTQDYNLRMAYQRVGTRPGTGRPPLTVIRRGEPVTLRGWVRNQVGTDDPTNQGNPGANVRFFFPAGISIVSLPAPHALRTCALDPVQPGVQSVTCVFNSPLAPHVSSLGLDLVISVPEDWPPGRLVHTVACVHPAAGQAPETVPPAAQPCEPGTPARTTTTDNDAGLLLLTV